MRKRIRFESHNHETIFQKNINIFILQNTSIKHVKREQWPLTRELTRFPGNNWTTADTIEGTIGIARIGVSVYLVRVPAILPEDVGGQSCPGSHNSSYVYV